MRGNSQILALLMKPRAVLRHKHPILTKTGAQSRDHEANMEALRQMGMQPHSLNFKCTTIPSQKILN